MFYLKLLFIFLSLWTSFELFVQALIGKRYTRYMVWAWAAAITGCIALFLL